MKKFLIILSLLLNTLSASATPEQHIDTISKDSDKEKSINQNIKDNDKKDSGLESSDNIKNEDSIKDSTSQQPKNIEEITQEQIVASTINQEALKPNKGFFDVAEIEGDTFGSFSIGYQFLSKKYQHTQNTHGVFFSLERGWAFFYDKLLLSITLDGTAGSFYSINGNFKLASRLFDGRVIPSISVGYGLLNHIINKTQYNLHGTNSTFALFFDVGHGFGIEIGYRLGLHTFHTTKKSNVTLRNIHSFMFNFRFIDFSI